MSHLISIQSQCECGYPWSLLITNITSQTSKPNSFSWQSMPSSIGSIGLGMAGSFTAIAMDRLGCLGTAHVAALAWKVVSLGSLGSCSLPIRTLVEHGWNLVTRFTRCHWMSLVWIYHNLSHVGFSWFFHVFPHLMRTGCVFLESSLVFRRALHLDFGSAVFPYWTLSTSCLLHCSPCVDEKGSRRRFLTAASINRRCYFSRTQSL